MAYVGKRVKQARKLRGLTRLELAEAAGVSVSTLRKLEQEERPSARMETLHALAKALRVPTMSLVKAAEPGGPRVSAATDALWESARAALMKPPVQPDDPATVTGVTEVLEGGVRLYRSHRFGALAAALPPLIRDADALGGNGRPLRHRVLQLAAGALTHTRQFDVAEAVLTRALDTAGDRMESAATVNTLCWLLMRRGRLDEALALATRWADELEPRISRATAAELAAWGLVLLNVSAAAVRDNQPGVAADALRLARAAAAIGREVHPAHEQMRTFGPTTVRMKAVEDALVRDHPDTALRLAARLPRHPVRPSVSVRARHTLAVAEAHARVGQYPEAFGRLSEARAASPEWFPNQTPARDVLRTVLEGRRALTPEMRAMAKSLGL
ncbi:helix-turn-helix domain-containing protein [Streptomyces sp. MS19]|uniref:helix-turn-helix domain-containing protein n=1 Tax=Streptomyces sp. MS19 TaxID=3385972 RepID=UPI0039A14655